MNKPEPTSSGSSAGVVILIALLVLAIPCLAGVVLLGAGFYWVRAVPAPAPPPAVLAVPADEAFEEIDLAPVEENVPPAAGPIDVTETPNETREPAPSQNGSP